MRLLFDTGADGAILLANMRALGITPISIDEVFISHIHFDHAGGLSSFLGANRDVKVYAPDALRGIRSAREVVYVDSAMELRVGVYTTGMLNNEEQSLAIRTNKGMVVVAGCSHPGVESILDAVRPLGKPFALIGGLHGFDNFEVLQPLSLICPTHCTQYADEIRSRYPDTCIQGGVGVRIDL